MEQQSKTDLTDLLIKASESGCVWLVKELLASGRVYPKARGSWALRWAAANGHLEIIKLLLPVSDPRANDSQALRGAAANGHLEIVKLLLPVSDPKANDSEALQAAALKGHLEIGRVIEEYVCLHC